jgi:hypothetical protein
VSALGEVSPRFVTVTFASRIPQRRWAFGADSEVLPAAARLQRSHHFDGLSSSDSAAFATAELDSVSIGM